jgi:tetratricopeptide (TPR) repeat protein
MNRLVLATLLALALPSSSFGASPAKAKPAAPKPSASSVPELTPEVALLLARQRILAKDLDGADEVLRDAQKRFPAAHGFHLLRGSVEEARGNARAALWEYQWEMLRAGADRPSGEEAARRSSALVRAGSSDALRVKKVLEAMQAAGTSPDAALSAVAAERKSADSFVLRVFETELRASDDAPGSVERFEALLAIDPHFVPAHVGLARALGRSGKMKEAEEALAKAVALDPGHWAIPK